MREVIRRGIARDTDVEIAAALTGAAGPRQARRCALLALTGIVLAKGKAADGLGWNGAIRKAAAHRGRTVLQSATGRPAERYPCCSFTSAGGGPSGQGTRRIVDVGVIRVRHACRGAAYCRRWPRCHRAGRRPLDEHQSAAPGTALAHGDRPRPEPRCTPRDAPCSRPATRSATGSHRAAAAHGGGVQGDGVQVDVAAAGGHRLPVQQAYSAAVYCQRHADSTCTPGHPVQQPCPTPATSPRGTAGSPWRVPSRSGPRCGSGTGSNPIPTVTRPGRPIAVTVAMPLPAKQYLPSPGSVPAASAAAATATIRSGGCVGGKMASQRDHEASSVRLMIAATGVARASGW